MEYLEKPQKQNRLQKILGSIVRKSSPLAIKALDKAKGVVDEVKAAREGTKAKNRLLASVELTPEAKKLLKTTSVKSYSDPRYNQKAPDSSDGVYGMDEEESIRVRKSTTPDILLHELSHANDFKKSLNVEKGLKEMDSVPDSNLKNRIAYILGRFYGIDIDPTVPIPRKQKGFKDIKVKLGEDEIDPNDDPFTINQIEQEYTKGARRSGATEGKAFLLSESLLDGLNRVPEEFRKGKDVVDYDKSLPMSKLKSEKVNPAVDFAVNLLQPSASKGIRYIKNTITRNPLVSAIKSVIK